MQYFLLYLWVFWFCLFFSFAMLGLEPSVQHLLKCSVTERYPQPF
jgi:hypothetical protein